MVFWILLFGLVMVPHSETCVRTIPPEEVFITSTEPDIPTDEPTEAPGEETTEEATTTAAAESMCDQCNIDDIAPTFFEDPVLEYFDSDELDPVDGCQRREVYCNRLDTMSCDAVHLYATNADGKTAIEDEDEGSFGSALSVLSCDADGTYSAGTVSKITQLDCEWVNCMPG